ncbi:MAG TPA: hypothetical protein VFQ63_01945 [Patescibacteria group bacterium]|nr:hypothetical protein [Patescibacteria group bacterium]
MRSSDSQKQKITIVAIILTVVGLLLTVWAGFGIFQSAQTQLNSYQNLGL